MSKITLTEDMLDNLVAMVKSKDERDFTIAYDIIQNRDDSKESNKNYIKLLKKLWL